MFLVARFARRPGATVRPTPDAVAPDRRAGRPQSLRLRSRFAVRPYPPHPSVAGGVMLCISDDYRQDPRKQSDRITC